MKQQYTGLEIAIIGMAGRFPGAADIHAFWDNLKNGVESIRFFTDGELLSEGEDPAMLGNPNYVKANAWVESKEYFDSAFFNYRPDEARLMDPQVRIFHECVWEALEDAACNPGNNGHRIGLFAGAGSNTNWEVYANMINREGLVDPFTASHLYNARFIATRISYLLNLRGPAVYLDTACSTSLVAIHHACKSLLTGECSMAVAGGVSITNKSRKGYLYKEGMILSRDGHCRTFDAQASGVVGGEGAAVVVLKTLKNALTARDHIYAIIKGSGINNDGNNKVGYTAPSGDGQYEAIVMAQKWARTEPESITCIEAHGTATRLGDPVEVQALSRAFGSSSTKYCALGSVKSNIGHLDAAAGAAGLIKTTLALQHKLIPPSLHFTTPNPDISFAGTPFYVNTELTPWQNDRYPLRAGVSSFGIGGTNAHVILEEAPAATPSGESRPWQLLLVSAKNPAALERNCENLANYLRRNPDASLPDVACTLQTGRMPFSCRKSIVCGNHEEAIRLLTEAGNTIGPLPEKARPSIVFMFPGQGTQYVNMCHDLYNTEAFFRQEADACFRIIQQLTGRDLKSLVFPENETGHAVEINNTVYTQPLLFTVEYALARLLMHWGIHPDVMIGHSIGEYVAACISGVFTPEDALRLVIRRAELMQQAAPGVMLAIAAPVEEVMPWLQAQQEISLAAVNGPQVCVVSGADQAVERFRSVMQEKGHASRLLRTSHAFHSHMMDGILNEFEKEVQRVTIRPPGIPFISNLTGQYAKEAEILDAGYWRSHLRHTVQFSGGIQTLMKKKDLIFVEAGPGHTLCSLVRGHMEQNDKHPAIALVRQEREEDNDCRRLLSGLGRLWEHGIVPDWKIFYEKEQRNKMALPLYSFDKIKYPVNVDAFRILSTTMPANLPVEADAVQTANTEFTNAAPGMSDMPGQQAGEGLEPGASHTEKKFLHLWSGFFGSPAKSADDDFFTSGGDSLKALTFIGRIQKIFRVNISLEEFFKRSTVRGLLNAINDAQELNRLPAQPGSRTTIPGAKESSCYPLSPAQRRLFFLHEFNKSSMAYNMPQAIRLQGELDKQRVTEVFNQLVLRHENLRTTFAIINEQPVQLVNSGAEFKIKFYFAKEEEIDTVIRQFIQPFDLTAAPLMRAGLIEIAAHHHVLLIDMHHIIADGISHRILLNDFVLLYNGDKLPEKELQYKDYAVWQQDDQQQEKIAAQKTFWLTEFEEEVMVPELPADFQRPARKSFEGAQVVFDIPEADTGRLKAIAQQEGATLFMVMLALYNILLSRLSNQEDIVTGTPAAGRQYAELEDMMGMFVNTLPIRNYPKGELTFREFLKAVKAKTLTCFDNQQYQYEDLVDELKVPRNTSRNPLFDVLFSYQNIAETGVSVPGLVAWRYDLPCSTAQFDLTLWVLETGNKLQLKFEYATALFREETIGKFVGYLKNILNSVIANSNIRIAAIDLLPPEERKRVVEVFNHTHLNFPAGKTIPDIFRERVRQGGRIALTCTGVSLTYAELNDRSDRLARRLCRAGVEKNEVIGVLMSRSHDLIISILAILKAGGAYLPLDPEYPAERIKYMLRNAELKRVLTEPDLLPLCRQLNNHIQWLDVTAADSWAVDEENLPVAISPASLAYLIYTSGSTGNPKGVMISHRNVINFMHGVTNRITFAPENNMLSTTTVSFDIFVLETLVPLMLGMHVVLAPAGGQRDGAVLAGLISRHSVDMLQLTPSHLRLLLTDERCTALLRQVKVLMIGGEALPAELLRHLQLHYSGRIYNMYGPTETTVWSAISDLTDAAAVNIGKPIANTVIRIIDRHGNLQPIGVAGELCIGGEGLSRGYWKNEPLTREKFIADPSGGSNLVYCTGDCARWLPDGNIEFLGRMDNQVKLRGYRIELGEIECRLTAHELVREAVVTITEKEGDKYLVAYYVSDEEIVAGRLNTFLSVSLPAYMLPAFYVRLEKLPLTPNGKLNRKALPDPVITTTGYTAPTNKIEEQLAELWAGVLKTGMERIGIHQNFFELGGHSLKATILSNKINRHFKVEIPVHEIFARQTIEQQADYLHILQQVRNETEPDNDIIEIAL